MKYSVAALTAVVGVVAARPEFTNSNFNIVEGEPFELTFTGCESGCTIYLRNGESGNLQPVDTLATDVTEDSFTVNLGDRPTDDYAFEIVANDDLEDPNWSLQFEYGSGAPVESSAFSSASSSAPSTTVVTSTTVSVVTSTTESSESSETTEASETTETTETTESVTTTITSAISTETQESTTVTHSTTATQTTAPTGAPDPDSGAERLASPLALIGCAIAAMAYLN